PSPPRRRPPRRGGSPGARPGARARRGAAFRGGPRRERDADLRHHDRRRQAQGRRHPAGRARRAPAEPRAEPCRGRGRAPRRGRGSRRHAPARRLTRARRLGRAPGRRRDAARLPEPARAALRPRAGVGGLVGGPGATRARRRVSHRRGRGLARRAARARARGARARGAPRARPRGEGGPGPPERDPPDAGARAVVERELGSVSDNPLVFPADGAVLSGGNFHGEVLGLVLDTLAIGLAQLTGIAERRVDRLVNPLTSEGLPPFLSPHGGLHSGYMLAQYVAAALVAEMKTLAHPASVDSIPTSGLQEDYNSMGAGAALKLRRALGLVRHVLAIELLVAAQALDLRAPLAPGRGSAAARAAVRRRVAPLGGDRYLKADLDAARAFVEDGSVLAAVETALGPLG